MGYWMRHRMEKKAASKKKTVRLRGASRDYTIPRLSLTFLPPC